MSLDHLGRESSQDHADQTRHPAQALSPGDRWRTWVRLSKVDSVAIYGVPLLVGLSVVPPAAWGPRAVCCLALALVGTVGVFTATVVLDDVRGYRDGSDAANYRRAGDLRGAQRKPLVSGLISPGRALVLARVAWAAGGSLWCAAVGLAPVGSAAVWALAAGLVLFAPQYSWGLRLSYRCLGEALMAYFSLALVVLPPLGLGGEWDARLLSQAALVALWHVQVSSYANTGDVPGDRDIGRRSLATLLGPRGNHRYLLALATIAPVCAAAVVAVSPVPWWSGAFLLPVVCAGLGQARRYHRTGDAPVANKQSWKLYRVGGLALAAGNAAVQLHGVAS